VAHLETHSAVFEGNAKDLYGEALARELERAPDSAFAAEGSAVTVYHGRALTG